MGACVDCSLCVQVCPTGIDIRKGLQYECIACAACIDACDEVMDKVGYPRGLIRYSTENAVSQRLTPMDIVRRAFRPRVIVYAAILLDLPTAAALTLCLWWTRSVGAWVGLSVALIVHRRAVGTAAFREPVPAYKHSAAVYLKLTGRMRDPLPHPDCPRRPDGEADLLVVVAEQGEQRLYDVVIYGDSSGAVIAAIAAKREGRSVVLVNPTGFLGGMSASGLGATDFLDKRNTFGGIASEYYDAIAAAYGTNYIRSFEPSMGKQVFEKMIADAGVTVVYGEKLDRAPGKGVKMNGQRIESITTLSGKTYRGKMFIDATYVGDLMAAAGVTYTVGREPESQYGEDMAGVRRGDTKPRVHYTQRDKDHFVKNVDPYVKRGDPGSGLLPYVFRVEGLANGQGDKKIQAYNYRVCLTTDPKLRIPIEKPAGYREIDHELLLRNFDAGDMRLPALVEGDSPELREARAEGHETQPPPRFNEASLVKFLEENGIGRPSTYAEILRKIELSRSFADEVLDRAFTADPELRRLFEDEARLMPNLVHPNLVRIYEKEARWPELAHTLTRKVEHLSASVERLAGGSDAAPKRARRAKARA